MISRPRGQQPAVRPVAATRTKIDQGPSPGGGHYPGGLRRHQRRVGKRGEEESLDPLAWGNGGGDAQQRLARENDGALGNGPDIALEPQRARASRRTRSQPVRRPGSGEFLDLLGRECQREQVADRLLEPGEDQVGTMRRHPPDEELEGGLLARPCPEAR